MIKTYKIELWKDGQVHGTGFFDAITADGGSASYTLRDSTGHLEEAERSAIEAALSKAEPPAEGTVHVATFQWKLTPVETPV